MQQAIACADQLAAASGAYKNAAVSRQTHAATILLRCWLEAFTFPFLYDVG